MAEIRRGFGGDAGERLPWLEPVEDEDDVEEVGGFGGLIIGGLLLLVAIVLVVAGIVWFRHSRAQTADIGTLIAAPATPYKTRPTDPGGMEIASAGAVAERTGVGGDINSPIDLTGLPEQPVVGPGSTQGTTPPAPTQPQAAQAQPAQPPVAQAQPTPHPAAPAPAPVMPPPPALVRPQPAPAPTTVASAPVRLKPAPVPPRPVPVAPPVRQAAAPAPATDLKGGTIQLGAFSTAAKATSVWKALSSRFGPLAALGMSVNPVQSGSATLYRLRASGAGAGKVCAQLRVAGESCSVVG